MDKNRALLKGKFDNYTAVRTAELVTKNGFPECAELIITENITGKVLLSLSQFEVRLWRHKIPHFNETTFWSFLQKLQSELELFIEITITEESKGKVMNREVKKELLEKGKPVLTKKPEIVTKKPEIVTKKPDLPAKKPDLLLKKPEVISKKLDIAKKTTEIAKQKVINNEIVSGNDHALKMCINSEKLPIDNVKKDNVESNNNINVVPAKQSLEIAKITIESAEKEDTIKVSTNSIDNLEIDKKNTLEVPKFNLLPTPPINKFPDLNLDHLDIKQEESDDCQLFEIKNTVESEKNILVIKHDEENPPPIIDRSKFPKPNINLENNAYSTPEGCSEDDELLQLKAENEYEIIPVKTKTSTGTVDSTVAKKVNRKDVYDEDEYLKPIERRRSSSNGRRLPPTPIQEYTLNDLQNETYFRNSDRAGACRILHSLPIGAFLVRPSKLYFCCISAKSPTRIVHVGVEKTAENKFNLVDTNTENKVKFHSVTDLVNYYMQNGLMVTGFMMVKLVNVLKPINN